MEEVLEVRRVLQRKDGIKFVIIPKKSKIKKDELVMVLRFTKEGSKNE